MKPEERPGSRSLADDSEPLRPPPSRSYAPDSLTPFTPLQLPEIDPTTTPHRGTPVWVYGAMLGLSLVAFVVGIVIAVVALR